MGLSTLASSVYLYQPHAITTRGTCQRGHGALHDEAQRKIARVRARWHRAAGRDELVASGIDRSFLQSGLGHSVDLVCHDVGCALFGPLECRDLLWDNDEPVHVRVEAQILTIGSKS